jgi:M6 family metalloprotease-like protein
MKNITVKIFLTFVLISASCFSSVFTQVITYGCALDENNFPSLFDHSGKNKPLFPASGVAKVLVIYCKFVDDYFDYPPYTDLWPGNLNTLPQWTVNTVAPSTQMESHHPSITGYFNDMSRGKLKVIGDVCPVLIIPRLPSYYYSKAVGSNISYLTKEVLEKADPYVNYSDYDHYDPDDFNQNGIYDEPDGTADMIIICFRNIPIGISAIDDLGNYSGIASLTGAQQKFPGEQTEIIKDGIKIKAGVRGSGTFQHSIFDLHGQLHIIAHEIGHYLFNGTIGHLFGTGYYTLMSGIGCGVMSAFEKEQLGWVDPQEVNGNIYNATLTDVITSGVVYKIPIANPPHNYPLHLYIENYQSQSFYVREWLTGHGGVPTIKNTGVLITEANSSVYLSEIKCADGKWNWDKKMYLWHYPWFLKDWLYTYPFLRLAPNPDSGVNEMNLIGLRYDRNDNTLMIDHPDVLGDADDFYNIDYNDVYSAWSNPNTYPYSQANICVELTGKIFKTIYANFYVEGNSPVDAKPSKPQLWKIEIINNVYPKITWLQGREPDLAGYYVYRKKGIKASWENIADKDNSDYEFTDLEPAGDTVFYKIRSFDTQGKFSIFSDVVSTGDGKPSIPETGSQYKFSLSQNYPNPFNPVTNIYITLPRFSDIKLTVFDITGREVGVIFKGYLPEGLHEFLWDGTNYPSGVYFYRLEAGVFSFSRKMILVK